MDNQKILRLLRYVLAGLTLVSLCLVLLRQIEDPDFFWHLATGRWIIENLSLPTHDPFSYATPALSSSREYFILTSYWLNQILYYGIYYISGWNGFIILRFIILGVLIYFVYKRAKGSDITILFSVIAITSVVFVQTYTFERPQVFSFVFFAILLYLLEKQVKAEAEVKADKQAKVKAEVKKKNLNLNLNLNLFLLPLLMLLWANMHGGYIIGQAVILVYLLSEGLKFLHPSLRPMDKLLYKKFLITGIAGILSAMINPNTYKVIPVMWNMPESITLYNTEVLGTIDFFKAYFYYPIPVYWLLLLIASAIMLYRIVRRRFDVLDIVMLAGLGYFSFTTMRYMAFFLIWAAPFVALSLTTLTTPLHPPLFKGGKEGGSLKYICVLLSLFIIVVLLNSQKGFDSVKNIISFRTGQWVSEKYPEDAVSFIIKNDIKGNMYNHYDWGGYLIWRFYPGKKVFIDGRDLYGNRYLEWVDINYAALKPEVMGMPYYKAVLDSYRVRYMLIPLFIWRGEVLPIVSEIIKDKEWVPVFFSGNAMIFVKDTPENCDIIKAYAIPKDVIINKISKMLNKVMRMHR